MSEPLAWVLFVMSRPLAWWLSGHLVCIPALPFGGEASVSADPCSSDEPASTPSPPSALTCCDERDAWLTRADEMLLSYEIFGDPSDWDEARRRCVAATLCSITSDAAWARAHDRNDA